MGVLARRLDDDPVNPREPRLGSWIADHQAMVWRFLRYLGAGAELAEDLAQEVFVAALDKGLPQDDRDPGPWLRATARNLWVDHQRRLRRRPGLASLEDVESAWLSAAGNDGGEARKRALESCLGELDRRARDAVEMRYARQEGRAAMAAALGVSEAGVKALLRRIRHALRRCIERRMEIDHDD